MQNKEINLKHVVLLSNKDETMRIDKYLSQIDNELLHSRSQIERLIEEQKVKVNNRLVLKKSREIKDGDIIELDINENPVIMALNCPEGENIPIDIVYEDEYLIVVDKPAGMTVHPAPGNYKSTLVNALIHYSQGNLSTCAESFRPGIVHRLDKDTSGLIIIAKNNKMHAKMAKIIQERKITKKYKTILVGSLADNVGTINLPIARSNRNRKKMIVCNEGKEAITKYKVIKNYEHFSYVDVELITGRTHQIRVHFASLNCPVLGDQTYNSLANTLSKIPLPMQKRFKAFNNKNINRQALHAYGLEFIHPATNKLIELYSPLPNDLLNILSYLDKDFT